MELLFSGENRRRELQRLRKAFDEVAANAQSLDDGLSFAGTSHRVVVIEAERGLGKTRLALELYRLICASNDPAGYWPKNINKLLQYGQVMPRAEQFDFRRPIPFLWWGLSVAPEASVGSTVLSSLPDLLPHLVAARIAAQRRESGKELIDEAARLALDLGLPMAEAALELTGVGTVKRLGEAAFKIGKVVNRHRKEEPHAIIQGKQQTDLLTDTVLSDLETLFSKYSKNYAGVPLVVFVDDAQFANSDREVATLVERLISKASQENWPLLLIVTHWARQMREWVDGAGKRHPPSRIARVLRHASDGTKSEPGPFAKVGGGGLPESALTKIDLSEPVDGLARALQEVFSGLSDVDLAGIESKSGGNPRKLEQIAVRMSRNPKWFKKRDSSAGLTDLGREFIMNLAELPIDDIVLDQFADTPPEVRRAAMVASLMGNRFVCDLVERLAEALKMEQARSGLEDAECQYRFLREVIDRSRNDIGSFSEQLFIDAAKHYRESGMAGRDLPDWPEEEVLLGVLDEILGKFVSDPHQFRSLGLDDKVEALNLASKRMKKAEDPSAGLALARLVEVETVRGNPEGAYYAAAKFMEGFEP